MDATREAVRPSGPHLSHETRDACLHDLGALHAAGKLSLAELDARIAVALAARTDEELAALVRDEPRIEVATRRRPGQAQGAAVAPRLRRLVGLLDALRSVVLVARSLLLGLVRMLTLAAAALSVGTARALLATARGGRSAYRALVRRSRRQGAVGRAGTRVVPAGPQTRGSASRELVLAPRPQVPAQREPVKVHPVLVPTEPESCSTALVLARRSTDVVLVKRPVTRGEVVARDLTPTGMALPGQQRRGRGLVSQLRPLIHRVADRARRRRWTAQGCERAANTMRRPRTVRVSRTAF